MKAPFTNKQDIGFSTLELIIALALLSVILVGAFEGVSSAQYWYLTAETASTALIKNKNLVDYMYQQRAQHFQSVSNTAFFSPECLEDDLCYYHQTLVSNVSSCAKEVLVSVSWKLGLRYATSSVETNNFLSNTNEIIAKGGDCLVSELDGDWHFVQHGDSVQTDPLGNTSVDVLGEYMYVTSQSAPYIRVYKINDDPGVPPALVGEDSDVNIRLNDVDVVRDFSTGRLYAYATTHSTTSQLVVYDVTQSDAPDLLLELPLFNVASAGSFPQGWRVIAYGGKLYVVSRETTGPELHIFSIGNPRAPIELIGGAINLNRTVNDMVVRDETVGGVTRRYLYLAASSDLKEVGVYDVTGSVPIEVAAINLNGGADAASLHLTGDTLYIGRDVSSASELYAFNIGKLISGETGLLASSEVGAGVHTLSGSGRELILGTTKSGAEFQVWNTDVSSWSASMANAGRLTYLSVPRLAPLGFDVSRKHVYGLSQSLTLSEVISTIYSP
jgi:hypothetical protein